MLNRVLISLGIGVVLTILSVFANVFAFLIFRESSWMIENFGFPLWVPIEILGWLVNLEGMPPAFFAIFGVTMTILGFAVIAFACLSIVKHMKPTG